MDNRQINPYEAPESQVVEKPNVDVLAGRLERFAASFIDGLLFLALLIPAMYFGGYFTVASEAAAGGGRVSFGYQLLWGLVASVLFVVLQGYPLAKTAQTWGKRLLRIRVENMDGTQPSLAVLILRRFLPIQLAGQIPIVGGILVLLDPLLIFGREQRCAHDLIAGTRVVKAD